ncbi:uncharacterized protein LOC117180628 [Belonocnema kinseyi]|uniref:uncharacterized protein LOC117180628 n=1 Tax=Belonocnema kinseyi TaxID=2817044 RepID=UPI00143DF821|nr:uncharacterized protein LOC117180628 [Belonocnema kinseyi]
MPRDLYYEDANRVLHPLPPYTPLLECGRVYIGRVVGTYVFPLFNINHKIVMHERFGNEGPIVIGPGGAQELGIPGTLQQVAAAIHLSQHREAPSAEEEARHEAENERTEAVQNRARQATENERREAAENQLRKEAENVRRRFGWGVQNRRVMPINN